MDSAVPFKSKNKLKRQDHYQKEKKLKENAKRDFKFKRKREEDKNPNLRTQRRTRNVPVTLEHKRVWDVVDDADGDGIGLSVDIERFKKQKLNHDKEQPNPEEEEGDGLTETKLQRLEQDQLPDEDDLHPFEADDDEASASDDLASILADSDSELDDDHNEPQSKAKQDLLAMPPPNRKSSPPLSTTSTNLSLIPEALASKFPTLFNQVDTPKILITTTLNGTIHDCANLLTDLFPNSTYIPRQRHHYKSHHFSLREIARFAHNRSFTTLVVLNEDQKRPAGLTVIHLPSGPTFHFSISNWVDGKKLPGHGRPTDHYPELILNNFRTPLGLLTAHLFRTIFPPQPEHEGRQVVTLHNQRDYIFVRRHRYVFRDKRPTEKSIVDLNGAVVKGAEAIKAGLQELGPRFTLKLRRLDKGIQRASGQEWEWKAGMEKVRTRFNL